MTSATDNRTTELTATERICEQLEAAGVSFVRSEQIIEGTYWGVTWFVGETKFEFRENDKRTDLMAFNATPEQAIAATLGETCELSKGCRKPIGGVDSCRRYVRAKESNYQHLFGTPERAARTLEKGKTLCAWCDKQTCSTSGGECRIFDYDALLEWLGGEAE